MNQEKAASGTLSQLFYIYNEEIILLILAASEWHHRGGWFPHLT